MSESKTPVLAILLNANGVCEVQSAVYPTLSGEIARLRLLTRIQPAIFELDRAVREGRPKQQTQGDERA
jgi:hypothetical protein